MTGFLLLLFTVVPLVELTLILSIGTRIGVLWTVVIVLGTGITGAFLAKMQGLLAVQRVQNEMAHGRVPGREILDAVLILAAGLLLLTPGFLTDLTGFFLLLPFGRALVRAYIQRRLAAKVESGKARVRIIHFEE